MQQQYDDKELAKEYAAVKSDTKRFVLEPTTLKMAGQIEGKKVLDLGCGDGNYTRLLAQQNPQKIVGFDIAKEMITLAQENQDAVTADIHYILGDITTINLNETFDIVTAFFVLNFAKTKKELLQMCKNAFRHLKTGGKFCVLTLTPKLKPREVFLRDWRFLHPEGKTIFSDGDKINPEIRNPETDKISSFFCYYWTEETYTNALKDAGFSEVQWIYDLTISEEGTKRFGRKFWQKWKETSSTVGILSIKK